MSLFQNIRLRSCRNGFLSNLTALLFLFFLLPFCSSSTTTPFHGEDGMQQEVRGVLRGRSQQTSPHDSVVVITDTTDNVGHRYEMVDPMYPTRSLAEKATKAPTTTKSATLHPSPSPTSTPTLLPSGSPSISQRPSSSPSGRPTVSQIPSLPPSGSPSTSANPSSNPSASPSTSQNPSVSPSTSPSASQNPSMSPSEPPSTSLSPSMAPSKSAPPSQSASPSESPSTSPTDSEVCLSGPETLLAYNTLVRDKLLLATLYYSLTEDSQSTLSNWAVKGTGECSWSKVSCDDGTSGSVTKLDFTNLDLDGTIPTELQELTTLKTFELTNNPSLVGNSWEAIGSLNQLTSLSLDENYPGSLSSEIGNLNNLKRLDLGSNDVKSLPTELGNLSSLTYLNVFSNQLRSLPSELGNLVALRALDVDLNGSYFRSVPSELGNLTQLTRLGLSYNKLTSLPSELGNLSALKTLYLEENDLVTPLPSEVCALSSHVTKFYADCGSWSSCCN